MYDPFLIDCPILITAINIPVLHRFCLHKYHLIQLAFLSSSTIHGLLLLTIDF
jgi:hypothetical protein